MTRFIGVFFVALAAVVATAAEIKISASSSQPGSEPGMAFDGDVFGTNRVWRGDRGTSWFWEIDFGRIRKVGAVLQVLGEADYVLQNVPRRYHWLGSPNGAYWMPLSAAAVTNEQRLFRTIRFEQQHEIRFARLAIQEASGEYPAVREISFFAETNAAVPFPEWVVVVNATHDPRIPGEGREFIPLARSTQFRFVPAQQIWLDRFKAEFLEVEPRPLCAFISGSFKDWCEVRREDFRGMAETLTAGRLPIWASCGGAQALAIIAENGVEKEWDCPHCRDPKNPKTPIYTHIGHTEAKKCGDYSGCVFERGPHAVSVVSNDAAFRGLPRDFQVMESHCGQIEYLPSGWRWLVGPGPGTRTKHQAFRRDDRPIYAAQFHIEMSGAPESSAQIMKNFLTIAREWGGYQSTP